MHNFADKFDKASDDMIDYFLATNPKFEKIGKVAIFNELLYCENSQGLREGSKDPDDDWMMLLYKIMTSGINNQNDYKLFNERNNVSFITFNYDRVLEYFFWESLMNKFDLTPEQSNELVLGLDIHHVFGRLPCFEHEDKRFGDHSFPYQNFGKTRSDYKYAIENIKTLQERDNLDTNKISQLIGDAHRIFFLGFGFAEENLAVLNLGGNIKKKVEFYGTVLDLSQGEIDAVDDELIRSIHECYKEDKMWAKINIVLLDVKSKTLLNNYRTSLQSE